MRIIDADRYRKDLLSAYDDISMELEVLDRQPLVSAIPIPEGATNGDVFMFMFPNLKIEDNIGSIYMHDDNGISLIIDKKWLNAPYKRGRKNETCRKSRQVQKVRIMNETRNRYT